MPFAIQYGMLQRTVGQPRPLASPSVNCFQVTSRPSETLNACPGAASWRIASTAASSRLST